MASINTYFRSLLVVLLGCSLIYIDRLNADTVALGGSKDSNANISEYSPLSFQSSTLSKKVTSIQYCVFLNAVASTDIHNLYDAKMGSDPIEGCIIRSGIPGSYHYLVPTGKENLSITYVSWFSEARYCNWLHNGQIVGAQGTETTEDGAYTLDGIFDDVLRENIQKNEGAKYFLSSEEESDCLLKSNRSSFLVETSLNSTLMLMSSSTPTRSSFSKSDFFEYAAVAIF